MNLHDLAPDRAPTSSRTITPDEGRNVPWHYNNVHAVNTARQSLVGMDGLREIVKLDRENPELSDKVRELKERAVLFLEAMIATAATSPPSRRPTSSTPGSTPRPTTTASCATPTAASAAGTIVERADDYLAPVCHHFGENHLPRGARASRATSIGGCTLCDGDKVPFIDELDPEDNVNVRLERTAELREKGLIKPEVEWAGDGIVVVTLFLPAAERVAEFAALELGQGHEPARPRGHPQAGHAPGRGHAGRGQGPARRRPSTRPRSSSRPKPDDRCRPTRSAPSSPSTVSSASAPPSARTSTRWACARSSTSSTAASRGAASSLRRTWAPRCRSRRCSTPPSSTPPTPC